MKNDKALCSDAQCLRPTLDFSGSKFQQILTPPESIPKFCFHSFKIPALSLKFKLFFQTNHLNDEIVFGNGLRWNI